MRGTWDFEKRLVAYTDKKGRRTTYKRDAVGRVVLETRPAPTNAQWQKSYDVLDNLSSVTDPEGRTTRFLWNGLSWKLGTIDGNGALTQEIVYSPAGDVLSTFDGVGTHADGTFDLLGRVTQISVVPQSDPTLTTQMSYDASSNRVQVIDPRGVVQLRAYDSLERLTSTTDAAGTADAVTISQSYDPEGNLLQLTTGNQAKWQFQYDPRNLLTRAQDPESPPHVTQYVYDPARNLIQKTDANGQNTTLQYDELNRWTDKTFAGGHEQIAYDETGMQTSISNSTASIAQSFDEEDRLISHSIPAINRSLALSYDRAGLRTSLQNGAALPQAYTWDTNGRLASITAPGGAKTAMIYDVRGLLTHQDRPGNVSLDQTWDGHGRLIRKLYTHPTAGTLEDLNWTLDANGNILTESSLAGLSSYVYDNLNWLNQATYPDSTQEQFLYDRAGNRIQRTYTHVGLTDTTSYSYSASDRLTLDTTVRDPGNGGSLLALPSHTRTWDGNGNLTLVSTTTSAGTTNVQYSWNGLDQLAGVTYPDGSSSATSYYPASSLRLQQSTSGGASTRYLWDPGTQNVLEEIDATGSPAVQYLHGLGPDETIARFAGGATHTFIGDQVMSTRGLVDANGNLANSYKYLAFGLERSVQETVTNAVRFTGREVDAQSGLLYLRGRWMDRTTGRFISQDSIGFAGGLNLYAYGDNDPISATDPFGLWSPHGHDRLFNDALKGLLPPAQIKAIRDASKRFDRDTQQLENSHMHSLRKPGQTVEDAIEERNAFVRMRLLAARAAHIKFCNTHDKKSEADALRLFGEGMHPMQDSLSPAHKDEDGNPRLWDPVRTPSTMIGHSPNDWIGIETKNDITRSIYQQNRDMVRDAAREVFLLDR